MFVATTNIMHVATTIFFLAFVDRFERQNAAILRDVVTIRTK